MELSWFLASFKGPVYVHGVTTVKQSPVVIPRPQDELAFQLQWDYCRTSNDRAEPCQLALLTGKPTGNCSVLPDSKFWEQTI